MVLLLEQDLLELGLAVSQNVLRLGLLALEFLDPLGLPLNVNQQVGDVLGDPLPVHDLEQLFNLAETAFHLHYLAVQLFPLQVLLHGQEVFDVLGPDVDLLVDLLHLLLTLV